MWKKSDPVTIRLAMPDDAEAIAHCFYQAVHEKGQGFYLDDILKEWAPPVTAERIREHYLQILNPDEEIYVAVADGSIIGMMVIAVPDHKMSGLYVRSNPHGLVGTRLVKKARERMKELGKSEIRLDAAEPVVDFYLSRGFDEMGKSFERRGMNYIPMRSRL
jgi:GNAT superfamily N-acetyltransferase